MDKGLSSPKSNNIADYFIRSSPASSKERTPSDKTPCPRNKEPFSSPVSGSSRPAGRMARQGKRTKLIKRLSDVAAPAGSDAAGGASSANCGTMGSDTAALLAQICHETEDLGGDDDDGNDVVFQSETATVADTTKPQRGHRLKRRTSVEAELRVNGGPPATHPHHQQPVTSNVSSESRTSVGDSSPEVHVDNTSDNLGTLTISFEDFMKSQGGKDQSTLASSPADSSDLTDAAAGDLPSPKTVTVQAQVHLSPPLHSQNSTKIASIFKKNKVNKKKVAAPAPECEQTGPVAPKRKSNVVIEEEDLELAVIDVETGEPMKQKSTPAERHQFMKAFRQVGEAPKPNTKKNPSKKKDLKEGTENQHKLEAEEQPPDKAVDEENKAEEKDKAQKLTRRRRQSPTLSSDTPKLLEAAAADEAEQSPLKPGSRILRRSLRRQESNPSSKSPEKTLAESPVLMSTPKVRTPCQQNNIYKSEVLTVPSDTESPIR